MKESINFDSHIPSYVQLMDILRKKIQQAEWIPSDQIPGQQNLCKQYQVSRIIVRQALRELEFEGVICRQRKGQWQSQPLTKNSMGVLNQLE